MNIAEKMAGEHHPIGPLDETFGIHNNMIAVQEQSAFTNGFRAGAIGFAEWCGKNTYAQPWKRPERFLNADAKAYTTEQLFEIYLKSTEA